jgi:rod shape-determining protein MreD
MLPLGRQSGMPDLLAVAVVFWNVHQPRRVGVGLAFLLGLLMDVHQGALLGQHALAYTMLSFVAITCTAGCCGLAWSNRRCRSCRCLWPAMWCRCWCGLLAGDTFPGWWLLLAPLLEALLWPLATWLLLAPQRRAPDPDKNRPL